ncbi:restin [Vairimorpha necatrix]|uniref:Restin n=1 Tax=Vairimorpha necatrix TaxID=6039 RepID=A0AAX4JCI0_9MICR
MEIGKKINLFKDCIATVKYIGNLEGEEGIWIGLELNQPIGKHDGVHKEKRYFTCEEKCGIFMKESKLRENVQVTNISQISNNKQDLDYEYENNVQKIIKDSVYKAKIKKMKTENKKTQEKLKQENENLKKSIKEKDLILEKYKNTTENLLDKLEYFEIEARNIIENIVKKINKLKKQYIEEEDYEELCENFKEIMKNAIEENTEDLEKNIEKFYKKIN